MRRLFFMLSITLGLSTSSLLATGTPAAADDDEAGYYVVELSAAAADEDSAHMQDALEQHIGHLGELYDMGVLYMAGPYEGGTSGIAIVQAHSADEARGFFDSDPSVAAGLMQITGVHGWWAAFSQPDDQTFSVEQLHAMMEGEEQAAPADEAPSAEQPAPAPEEGWEIPQDGVIVHAELPATDLEQCAEFYGNVFDWQFVPYADNYEVFMTPDPKGIGGGFTTEAPAGSGAVFYIYCADIDSTLDRIEQAGGTRFMPRTPIPGMGWIALFNDPQGNVVGLFSLTDPPPAE